MANIKRDRWEMLRQRVYPTLGTNVIEVGDHLVRDSNGDAQPVSSITDTTGADASARIKNVRNIIARDYIGMAMSAKLTDKTPNVRVATDVVAEYEVPSALGSAKSQGAFVEPEVTDDGTTATGIDQQVNVNAGSPTAIGKLAKNAANAATLVTVHLNGVTAQPMNYEARRIVGIVDQHLELNTQTDGKSVRVNSRNYVQTTGGSIGMQSKPNQIITTTGDVIGAEFSPRANDAGAGAIIAVKGDPVVKDATAIRTISAVRAFEANIDLPNAGSVYTFTNDITAFRAFLDAGIGHTFSGKKSVILVATPNTSGWDYLFDLEANSGVVEDLAAGAAATKRIKIRIDGSDFFLDLRDA